MGLACLKGEGPGEVGDSLATVAGDLNVDLRKSAPDGESDQQGVIRVVLHHEDGLISGNHPAVTFLETELVPWGDACSTAHDACFVPSSTWRERGRYALPLVLARACGFLADSRARDASGGGETG